MHSISLVGLEWVTWRETLRSRHTSWELRFVREGGVQGRIERGNSVELILWSKAGIGILSANLSRKGSATVRRSSWYLSVGEMAHI